MFVFVIFRICRHSHTIFVRMTEDAVEALAIVQAPLSHEEFDLQQSALLAHGNESKKKRSREDYDGDAFDQRLVNCTKSKETMVFIPPICFNNYILHCIVSIENLHTCLKAFLSVPRPGVLSAHLQEHA